MCQITLEYLLECIELEEITTHTMFNTKMVCSNKIPFCMLYKDQLYIRASKQNKEEFAKLGYQPLVMTRSFYQVTTSYYPFPAEIINDQEKLKQFVTNAYHLCQSESDKVKCVRIRDLVNLQRRHEQLLNKVGIYTVDELRKVGADKAYKLLKKLNKKLSEQTLYKLHGAIQGKHAHVIKREFEEGLHPSQTKEKAPGLTFKTTFLHHNP